VGTLDQPTFGTRPTCPLMTKDDRTTMPLPERVASLRGSTHAGRSCAEPAQMPQRCGDAGDLEPAGR
jgi:hypothetical protein